MTLFPAIDRTTWFLKARFGMFIHWGLYSLHGHGEWALNREAIPLEEYCELSSQFDASSFDPGAWARLAKESGMKYMVLTTKHHEGFCLWNSRLCNFNSVNSAARRDLVEEFVNAVRKEGLKVGLYYSLGDWYNSDWAAGWKGDDAARERFMDYTHGLVRELMTNYGAIDVLWYDLPQCYSAREWRSVDLNAMVRSLQPSILINNRALTTEDFRTPEQHVTAAPKGRLWEACMTLNDNWGYCPSDLNYKSPKEVILNLVNAAAGEGNLLLNVGPDGQGKIPLQSQTILHRVGEWLRIHGESIYDTTRIDLPFNLWGPVTANANILYLHLKNYFGEGMVIGGLENDVRRCTLLTTGEELSCERRGDQLKIHGLPTLPPDDLLSVIKLELNGAPSQNISRAIGGADVFPILPP